MRKRQSPCCNLKVDWRVALARLEGAYADNTLRAYRADMDVFDRWCRTVQRRALPAEPQTVAAFIAHEADRCAAATLKRRLAAIRKVHRLFRMENPVTDEEVVIAMRRARRAKRARPQQALGLISDLRDQLIAACPNSLAGKRDRAMIALGYDTLCRRAELVGLRVEDLTPSSHGATQILIRRSKNDPYGEGRLGYVSPDSLKLVRTWLTAAKIESGYIFRAVRGDRAGKRALHPYSVNRILKQAARAAGLPAQAIEHLSGHSMRVGAAQDLIVSGLGVLPIMQAGGWKTMNVVGRYIEHANLGPLLEKGRQGGST
ncbi:MAG: tyrosine-type recombinase/integrase [Methylocystis sp.]|nr:tyrosine-type recombinase/integrase [Methylocystis sp.]